MNSTNTSFGNLLRRYRIAAGFTQEALAARAQLSARTIADLERGINRTPRHDTFELLLAALDLTTQQRTLFLAIARQETTPTRVNTSSFRLPIPPTPLIGRTQEMTHALKSLGSSDIRLLTLTGPAGIGKTRLGLQIAHQLSQQFVDGVVFISLAALREPSLLMSMLAQALGLQGSTESEVSQQVALFLQEKHLLLVLDNFEQILDAATFVAELLSMCPHLAVLVTSRVPLRLRAEQVLSLAPLAVSEAVALFQERAQAVQPKEVYDPQQVAVICEQLDCLPLAVELAVMHVKTLSLPELHQRLSHRLSLLRGGTRDLPTRQQTMEEAIRWSYDLLTESLQHCFRVLGVFVGGWTLEAAQAICQAEDEKTPDQMLMMLAALVDANLVQVNIVEDGPTCFNMLELIREYALQQLRTLGEEELYQRRHANYFARLSESAWSGMLEQSARKVALQQDAPNVRAAIHWAEERREIALGLQLARFSWGGWVSQSQISESEGLLERMLALSWRDETQKVPVGPRALALYAFGQSLLRQGQSRRAEDVAREALEHAQSIGDHCGMCSAQAILGQIAQRNGRLVEAADLLVKSDENGRRSGFAELRSFTLRNLAELARMQGNLAHATMLYEEALEAARSMKMTFGIAMITIMLGHLACQQQNYAVARARYREGLTLLRTFESPTYVAWCLEGYATALSAEAYYPQATRLCAAAAALRDMVHTPLPSAEREAFEHIVTVAKSALGAQAFEENWSRGAKLTNNQVIGYVLSNVCP